MNGRAVTKNLTVTACLCLVCGVTAAYAAEPAQIDRNSARIERLERTIDSLEQRIRQLEADRGSAGRAAQQSPDPLVGSWQCSNSIQNRNLTFLVNGQVIIEEPTLGNITRVTWTRLDAERITVSGAAQYEIRFTKADEFELTEVNRRSTATCLRQK